jgi:arylformamidase
MTQANSYPDASDWIDISLPIYDGMPYWPDNPPVSIQPSQSISQGDVCNVSKLTLGSHTGTHVDGQRHFIQDGAGIDAMPPEATIGPARVIEIQNPQQITAAELQLHSLQAGERLLFKTQNSTRCYKSDEFVEEFVHFAADGAEYIVEQGIQTVGVDYLSVGGYQGNVVKIHHILLGAKVWVIEGLNLAAVTPGEYELICLPIRLQNGDAGLARAILKPI